METSCAPSVPRREGKVRDIYDLGDRYLIVSTDRISVYDRVLLNPIPDKGRVLTGVSVFWFDYLARELGLTHHLVTGDIEKIPEVNDQESKSLLDGRVMLVKKCNVVPIECVVRGYLTGSGWKEYQRDGSVCGIKLPDGLQDCAQLSEPIFTPATKEEGLGKHDENISFERMVELVGEPTATELRDRSIEIYQRAAIYARERGIIIADTKFEWGWCDGELILIDEVLTPDSSRFWPADQYQPGRNQPSFDKQFVRDWATSTGWDKNSPPPEMPREVVLRTREKYIEAYERLTGQVFAWK